MEGESVRALLRPPRSPSQVSLGEGVADWDPERSSRLVQVKAGLSMPDGLPIAQVLADCIAPLTCFLRARVPYT